MTALTANEVHRPVFPAQMGCMSLSEWRPATMMLSVTPCVVRTGSAMNSPGFLRLAMRMYSTILSAVYGPPAKMPCQVAMDSWEGAGGREGADMVKVLIGVFLQELN